MTAAVWDGNPFTIGTTAGNIIGNSWRADTIASLAFPDDEGLQNATRHAVWQALLTKDLGADAAETIGDIHEEGIDEDSPKASQRDSWIDQYNNAKARQIAEQCIQEDGANCTDDELLRRIAEAIANGEFITDGDDPRIPADLRETTDPCDSVNEQVAPVQIMHGSLDVNGDSNVDAVDLAVIVVNIGGDHCPADIDRDHAVTVEDASIWIDAATGTGTP